MVDLAMSFFKFLTKFLIFWHPWQPWVCVRSVCWKSVWKWNLKQIEAIPPSVYYESNKSTGKETGKTHLCGLVYCSRLYGKWIMIPYRQKSDLIQMKETRIWKRFDIQQGLKMCKHLSHICIWSKIFWGERILGNFLTSGFFPIYLHWCCAEFTELLLLKCSFIRGLFLVPKLWNPRPCCIWKSFIMIYLTKLPHNIWINWEIPAIVWLAVRAHWAQCASILFFAHSTNLFLAFSCLLKLALDSAMRKGISTSIFLGGHEWSTLIKNPILSRVTSYSI